MPVETTVKEWLEGPPFARRCGEVLGICLILVPQVIELISQVQGWHKDLILHYFLNLIFKENINLSSNTGHWYKSFPQSSSNFKLTLLLSLLFSNACRQLKTNGI